MFFNFVLYYKTTASAMYLIIALLSKEKIQQKFCTLFGPVSIKAIIQIYTFQYFVLFALFRL